jgi:hypothetical protein
MRFCLGSTFQCCQQGDFQPFAFGYRTWVSLCVCMKEKGSLPNSNCPLTTYSALYLGMDLPCAFLQHALGTYSWFTSIVAPLPSFHHMQLKQRRWSLWNGKKRPGSITMLTRIFQRFACTFAPHWSFLKNNVWHHWPKAFVSMNCQWLGKQ